MSTFESIILGIVQSLTEFFPISSSAHLIILPNILGWEKQSLTFDLVLHFGTAMSLIVFFRNDLWNMVKNVILDFIIGPFKEKKITLSPDSRYSLHLLVGCLPAGFLGLFFGDYIEESVRDLKLVIVFLIIGTFLMLLAEMKARNKTSFKEIGLFRALFIGFFQSFALFPGISRSGATISGSMLSGLSRADSTKFSFLLSIPIVLGAALLKINSDFSYILKNPIQMTAAFFASFIFGLLALKLLTIFLKKGTLMPFIIYRIILVVFLIIFTSTR
jgi:undecaprenyl-diphosphatase